MDRYLFDLDGYVVLRGVLTPDEVSDLRTEINERGVDEALGTRGYIHAGFPADYYDDDEWTGEHGYRYTKGSYILDWGPKLRSLVAHPPIVRYLTELVGPAFRLDHAYGIFSRGRTAPHALHNGGTPFDPTQMYLWRDGQMYNSMVVVQFALTPVGPGDGGFCCIPGSHKANCPLPADMPPLDELDDEWRARVRQVPMAAGDALIFTEAVTHGALGWRGQGDRMALLYKYCQGGLQWERESPFVTPGHHWEPEEARILAGPYVGGRPPVLAADGH